MKSKSPEKTNMILTFTAWHLYFIIVSGAKLLINIRVYVQVIILLYYVQNSWYKPKSENVLTIWKILSTIKVQFILKIVHILFAQFPLLHSRPAWHCMANNDLQFVEENYWWVLRISPFTLHYFMKELKKSNRFTCIKGKSTSRN